MYVKVEETFDLVLMMIGMENACSCAHVAQKLLHGHPGALSKRNKWLEEFPPPWPSNLSIYYSSSKFHWKEFISFIHN